MKKILYLDCSSGISGDMFLASLIDCGLETGYLTSELRKIKIGGYRIRARKVRRQGIAAVKFDVIYGHNDDREPAKEKTFKGIVKLINNSALGSGVKQKAIAVFVNLADAEAKAHGVARDSVHFHEVGDIDSVVDIVGAAVALDRLRIDEVRSSPVAVGNPAPATAYLLKGVEICSSEIEHELVTPTGAALLKTFCKSFGGLPSMKITDVGCGAGSNDISGHPNILRSIIGENAPARSGTDTVTVLETNIDDMNPQTYEYLMERLLKAGALDVYLVPVIMKKSRPGCVVTVLAQSSKADSVADILFAETTTFGIRAHQQQRRKLNRKIVEVKTEYGKINVKLGYLGDTLKTVAPEYEDCKRAAASKNIPLREIIAQAALGLKKKGFKIGKQ